MVGRNGHFVLFLVYILFQWTFLVIFTVHFISNDVLGRSKCYVDPNIATHLGNGVIFNNSILQ
jgi:hypothetical protein